MPRLVAWNRRRSATKARTAGAKANRKSFQPGDQPMFDGLVQRCIALTLRTRASTSGISNVTLRACSGQCYACFVRIAKTKGILKVESLETR